MPLTLTSSSPGGYLDPSEGWEEGLITRLNEQLGVPLEGGKGYMIRDDKKDWAIKDCLSAWWRPHFDTFMASPTLTCRHYHALIKEQYPYPTPQSSAPKECKKIYLVELPPKSMPLAVRGRS